MKKLLLALVIVFLAAPVYASQCVNSCVLSNCSVKPRRSGRGYKERFGVDFWSWWSYSPIMAAGLAASAFGEAVIPSRVFSRPGSLR